MTQLLWHWNSLPLWDSWGHRLTTRETAREHVILTSIYSQVGWAGSSLKCGCWFPGFPVPLGSVVKKWGHSLGSPTWVSSSGKNFQGTPWAANCSPSIPHHTMTPELFMHSTPTKPTPSAGDAGVQPGPQLWGHRAVLMLSLFSFKNKFIGLHCLMILHKCQMYKSVIHLYTALPSHHPKSSLFL